MREHVVNNIKSVAYRDGCILIRALSFNQIIGLFITQTVKLRQLSLAKWRMIREAIGPVSDL